jgi:hypothetical protein
MISLDSDQNKALALIQEVNARDRDLPILAVSNRGDGRSNSAGVTRRC